MKGISLAVFIFLIVIFTPYKNHNTKFQTYIFSLPENAADQRQYCFDIPEEIILAKDSFNSSGGILTYNLYDTNKKNDNLLSTIYFHFPTQDQKPSDEQPPTADQWLEQLKSNQKYTEISVEEINRGELSGFLVNITIEENQNNLPLVLQYLSTYNENSQQYTGIAAGFYNLNSKNYETYLHILQSIHVKTLEDHGIEVSPDMIKIPTSP